MTKSWAVGPPVVGLCLSCYTAKWLRQVGASGPPIPLEFNMQSGVFRQAGHQYSSIPHCSSLDFWGIEQKITQRLEWKKPHCQNTDLVPFTCAPAAAQQVYFLKNTKIRSESPLGYYLTCVLWKRGKIFLQDERVFNQVFSSRSSDAVHRRRVHDIAHI